MSTLRKALNLPRRRESDTIILPLSYSEKNQAIPALRVKANDLTQWVLPWNHLVHGRHQPQGKRDQLVLTFVSHEVTISGRNLGPLAEAAANFRLDAIHAMAGSVCAVPVAESFIEEIKVRPVKDTAPQNADHMGNDSAPIRGQISF